MSRPSAKIKVLALSSGRWWPRDAGTGEGASCKLQNFRRDGRLGAAFLRLGILDLLVIILRQFSPLGTQESETDQAHLL